MSLRRTLLTVRVDSGSVENLSGGTVSQGDVKLFTRDAAVLCFQLLGFDLDTQEWVPFPVAADAALSFGIKPSNDRQGDFLVYSANAKFNQAGDWADADRTEGKLSVWVSCNTTPLLETFETGTVSADFVAEIQLLENGEIIPTTICQFDVRVVQDLVQGDEGPPTPAAPNYATLDNVGGLVTAAAAAELAGKQDKLWDLLPEDWNDLDNSVLYVTGEMRPSPLLGNVDYQVGIGVTDQTIVNLGNRDFVIGNEEAWGTTYYEELVISPGGIVEFDTQGNEIPPGGVGSFASFSGISRSRLWPAAGTLNASLPVVTDSSNKLVTMSVGAFRSLLAVYSAAETDSAITAAIDALIGDAPGALDTLNELAAALGDDEDFAASVTALLAGKLSVTGQAADVDPAGTAIAAVLAALQPLSAALTAYAGAADAAARRALIGAAEKISVREITDATGTLALTDNEQIVKCNRATDQTITIPPQSSVTWLADTVSNLVKKGAGDLIIQGGTGVTVNGVLEGSVTVTAQFQGATCLRDAEDVWIISGGI